MNLAELKERWLNKEITPNRLTKLLPIHKEELDKLFPYEGPIAAKFYAYVHNTNAENSWCEQSGKFRTFNNMVLGFRKFCGNQSQCSCNREYQESVRHSRTRDEINHIHEKRKNTNLQKYGFEYASQHDKVKAKAETTCFEKYGAKAPTLNPVVLDKAQKTIQENWGVNFPQQHPDIRTKTIEVFQNTYGAPVPAQNLEVLVKTKKTNLSKYGVVAPFLTTEHRETNRKTFRQKSWDSYITNRTDYTPLFTQEEFLDSHRYSEHLFVCQKCHNQFSVALKRESDLRCFACYPRKESWGETKIKQWLWDNNISFEQWNRQVIKPLEIDFYLPDLNVGIEFNGIFYHSDCQIGDKKYHQNKWKQALEKGVRLVQIWEHEMVQKPDIIFDRLSHVVGLKKTIVGARKCNITVVDFGKAKTFIQNSHLQGNIPTKHIWGLEHNGLLVALASFVKTRYSKGSDYELARYCILPGYHVPGGLSKLLNHAHQELGFKSLVSYSNLNWGLGNGYEKTGFELSHISPPNYWYWKNINDVQSRLKFQKHKIQGLAAGNTEQEIAKNLGYNRFYDAGNAVWIKKY